MLMQFLVNFKSQLNQTRANNFCLAFQVGTLSSNLEVQTISAKAISYMVVNQKVFTD